VTILGDCFTLSELHDFMVAQGKVGTSIRFFSVILISVTLIATGEVKAVVSRKAAQALCDDQGTVVLWLTHMHHPISPIFNYK